jgi:RNA polymerase sigma-70 factor (ECF subfamily)
LEQKLKLALKSADEQKIHKIFNEIYTTHGKVVYFTISQYIDNRCYIEDLTQEVFLNFFNRLNKTEISNIKCYLVISARNSAINFLRNKKVEIELDERKLIYNLCEKEDSDLCVDAINILNKVLDSEEVYIILQHVLYDQSFKNISIECDKNISTIMARYYRAIKKVKKAMRLEK